MKEIPNLRFGIKFTDLPVATTATLLKLCLSHPPQGGFTYASMRDHLRVEKALEGVEEGGIIKLEDTDYSIASKCVETATWPVFDKNLVAFAEQFGK